MKAFTYNQKKAVVSAWNASQFSRFLQDLPPIDCVCGDCKRDDNFVCYSCDRVTAYCNSYDDYDEPINCMACED